MRSFLKRALRHAYPDIDIVTCESAEDAFALIDTPDTTFDLLVTDVNLPGISGLELLGMLHARHAIPAVVMSSSAAESDISAAYDCRAHDYLVKPYCIDEYDIIAKRLGRKVLDGTRYGAWS